MDSLANVELLYNYSAKERFGDTLTAKLFDSMEANSQLSSFYNASPWFFVSLGMDYLGGKFAKAIVKNAPEKTKKALVAILIRQFKLSTKEAGAAADFLLSEALEKAVEELSNAIAHYDVSETLDKDIKDIIEKIKNSMLESKGPIIVTFG
ncbi:MAG: hypothetical protein LBG21_06160 [Campylobacteraceae bacterium]|jgi:hypothetical protein|nr:hypothetical protein [Campylobacteraceae bacterium]